MTRPNPTLPTQPYPAPFSAEHFYLVPLPWLQGVVDAGDLDARELLLAQVVEGQVIFAEAQSEQAWHTEAGLERPFFTRRTYERHRKRLLLCGLLRKYIPPPRPDHVTKAAWQDLQRGIKYTVTAWPTTDWLYRPHAYLHQRWPVWLGNSDVASRLIVLALLAQASRVGRAAGGRLPVTVTLSWRAIYDFAEQCLGAEAQHEGSAQLPAKLRKGVQELLVLNAVEEVAGGGLHYRLSLAIFAQPPQWSIAAMARQCQVEVEPNNLYLELVRDLMHHCWEPVTRLARVWNGVQAGRTSGMLLDESDLLDLQKFLRTQRPQTPPLRHDHILAAFFRQRAAAGRLVGGCFGLVAQEIQLVKATLAGEALLMPQTTVHGLAATQLWVRCVRNNGLTVAEAQEILAATRLVVWQAQDDGEPSAVVLVCHKPRALSVDFGYIVRANQLHGRIDYARPFEVVLRCNRPDPRLTLQCQFRLLLA